MAPGSLIQLLLLYLIVVGATLIGVLGQRRKAVKKQRPREVPQTPLRDIVNRAPRQPEVRPHRKIVVQTMPEKVAEGATAPARTPEGVEESAQQEETADIARDFDLRKAVIYSELLKPKFDSKNDR